MPRGDGTGPTGTGSMTGRGAGYCGGSDSAGFASAGFGRGLRSCGGRRLRGAGHAGGHGWRHRFWATGLPGWARSGEAGASHDGIDLAAERRILERQAEALRSELEFITRRLSKIGSGAESK